MAVYIVVVLLIVAYGCYLRAFERRDFLEPVFFDHPVLQKINGWSVTHLLFFGLLGVLFPGHHLQFLAVGIGWEVIETALGQNRLEVGGHRLQLIGAQDDDGRPLSDDGNQFWYGKESDIVVDMIGYCLGAAAAGLFGF